MVLTFSHFLWLPGTHLIHATESRQKVQWSVGIICAGRSPSLTPDITSDLFTRVNCSAPSGNLSHLLHCWRHESRSRAQIFYNLPSFLRLWDRCDIQHTAEIKYADLVQHFIGELKSSAKRLQATTVTRHLSNLLWVVSKPDEIYQIPSRAFLSSVWF